MSSILLERNGGKNLDLEFLNRSPSPIFTELTRILLTNGSFRPISSEFPRLVPRPECVENSDGMSVIAGDPRDGIQGERGHLVGRVHNGRNDSGWRPLSRDGSHRPMEQDNR